MIGIKKELDSEQSFFLWYRNYFDNDVAKTYKKM